MDQILQSVELLIQRHGPGAYISLAGLIIFYIIGLVSVWLAIGMLIYSVFSKNWKITRMSCVDRNIIRIAIFEMLFCKDIPAKVSINEAIDIGKKFGTDESGSFINGIIDSIRIDQDNEIAQKNEE